MDGVELVKDTLAKLRTNDKSIETATLDIKGEWYSNTNKPKNKWRDDLLKDVCAFANSSEWETGYLIFGLKEKPPHLNSISIEEDEASIQQIVSSNINPPPKIVLERVTVEDSHIYVLSVKGAILSLPYFAKLSENNYHIYVRRGSSTDHCRKADLDEMIAAKRDKHIDLRVEAHAIKSIKDINHKIKSAGDEEFLSLLETLNQYTERYSFKVYEEVLRALWDIERYLPLRTDSRIREKFFKVFQICLQTTSLVRPLNRKIPTRHINLLENGMHLCRTVCFNASKRYNSSSAFGEAVYTLRQILRFAHLNELKDIKKETLDTFDELKEYASRIENEDALNWINFQRKDALALEVKNAPTIPSQLLKKFSF